MNMSASSVKKCCGVEFTLLFRWVLYHKELTWGAKCLALAILDLPLPAQPSNSALARKLHSSPSQISLWRGELNRQKMIFRGKIPTHEQGSTPVASI